MYTLIIEDRTGTIADEVSFDQGSYTIGRVEGNDIILPSNAVSRTHARIFVQQGRCYIDDLGSANGVVVDGEQINARRELRNAAQVRIGDYTLYLEHAARPQEPGQDVLRTHVVANDQSTFKLVRVGDMFAGETFSLTEQINSVGRTDDNFILLSDPSISRNHAQIINEGMAFRVVDLGSSNGTRVNGKPVRGHIHIRTGDEVQLGNVRFIFAPGNQPIDPNQYAKPRSGGGGLMILVGVIVLVAVIAAAVIVIVAVSGDDEKPKEKKAQPEQQEPDPTEVAKAKFDAAVTMANEQNWGEAQRLLADVMAIEPEYPGAKDVQAQVIVELTNQNHLDQGDELLRSDNLAQAKSHFEQIPQTSVYYSRAQKKLETVNQRLATDAFAEGKKLCDDKPTLQCINRICEAITLSSELAIAKKYLVDLKDSKGLRKQDSLKARIDECIKP